MNGVDDSRDTCAELLHDAARKGDASSVRTLLLRIPGHRRADPEVQTQGYEETPLHIASAKGHSDVVSELLRGRADVNACRAGGFTALHLAPTIDVATLLLQHGADMQIKSTEGYTASERSLGGAAVQDFLSDLPSGEYKQHLAGETTLMKVQGMEGA